MTNHLKCVVLVAATMAAACTVKDTKAPPLTGPSEMALSLAVTANPEVLSADGVSATLISIEARDSNGQPAANIPLRFETMADGQLIDYGTLSARTMVTGSNGRASFFYTAPTLVASSIPRLDIMVTPTGTGDAASLTPRFVNIRLVPPGVIAAGGLTAEFSFTPSAPSAFSDVLFNASASKAPLGGAITSYAWNFGDGSTGSGVSAVHRFSAGTFTVTLTTTDNNGLTASSSQLINVQAGTPPTATFVFSPTEPLEDTAVFFNAGESTAAIGRRIVSYRWSWGDGSAAGTGVSRSHTFANPGTYVVLLTVTDDVGQTATATRQVTVCAATGCV